MPEIKKKTVEVGLNNLNQSKNNSKSKLVVSRKDFEKIIFLIHYYLLSITVTIFFVSDIVIILVEKGKPFIQILIKFVEQS